MNMTREEILEKVTGCNIDFINDHIDCIILSEVINAMQEYADQEVEKIIEIYKFNNTNTN